MPDGRKSEPVAECVAEYVANFTGVLQGHNPRWQPQSTTVIMCLRGHTGQFTILGIIGESKSRTGHVLA